MIEFKRLQTNVSEIAPFIEKSTISFCDISLGVKYMWREDFLIDYAIVDNTLIMKESCPDYKNAFYYPIGDNVENALSLIEKHCIKNNLPLLFCCIDNKTAVELCERYYKTEVYNDRAWSDYIYPASQFLNYSGKKLAGQRNHVNKFKREYPNYKIERIDTNNLNRIREFLQEFERGTDFSVWTEAQEQKKVLSLVENLDNLSNMGVAIIVDDKVVGFSVGERMGDTLIVHIEKALKGYSGVYPTLAQAFVTTFYSDGIKFVNREEDCGDMGLRISKLQYHPIEIKQKNLVRAHTLFDKVEPSVVLTSERLTISAITEQDKQAYFDLYTNEQLNKWWGYDYKEDLGKNQPSPDYFYNFQNSLKDKKEEFSFAVRLDGKMIGELVLHNFDFRGGVEMGFRFFAECQGKGYATESALCLKKFVLEKMGAKTLKSRCFKQNLPSKRLIERLGLKKCEETEQIYYFSQTF